MRFGRQGCGRASPPLGNPDHFFGGAMAAFGRTALKISVEVRSVEFGGRFERMAEEHAIA